MDLTEMFQQRVLRESPSWLDKWLKDWAAKMSSRWSDFTEEGGPGGARLGSLLLTVFVPDLEMGTNVVAGEEQTREEILSTAIQE